MKRLTCTTAFCIAVLAFAGCGGSTEEPREVPATSDEGAYETAVFAQSRAEWEPLAEQGDAESQRKLGIMYYKGQGVDRDFAVAFDWFTKAADQSDDVAQLMLGVMNAEGQGVPVNRVTAHMWLSLSAQQENPSAKIRLEQLTQDMSPEEVAEAQQLAENWKPGA